jgi:hypothetical protein
MPLSFDNEILDVECPRCGTKITETGRWFKQRDSKCPSCGAALDEEVGRLLEKAEGGLAEAQTRLADGLQRLSRRLAEKFRA